MTREYPSEPVCAVGAVVCQDGKVLLVRRGHEPSLGRWVLPGGGVELGETAVEAVRREIREECGIEITVGPVAAVVDKIDRDEGGRVLYHYVIIDYFAGVAGGDVSPGTDVTDARWVAPSDLAQYQLNAASMGLIRQALERDRCR